MLTKEKAAKQLSKRLRQLREAKGMSQEAFAAESGLGRAYYWRLEQGTINVTLNTLVKICNVLRVDLAALFAAPRQGQK